MPLSAPSQQALALFHPAVQGWFQARFGRPTAVQQAAWHSIGQGHDSLVVSPTGSGKTLAAFLLVIDRLFREREKESQPEHPTRALYISPLKALAVDVQKNLRLPLEEVQELRRKRGDAPVELRVGIRSGDTPSNERARLLRRPPDILISTPESLYLLLTSKARETLRGVDTLIVDEIHALAGSKRGAHLALSLERLDALLTRPAQRIGLSATVAPVERMARFLGGAKPVAIVNPVADRRLNVEIVVPVADMSHLPAVGEPQPGASRGASIWPHIENNVLDRILACRSTLVFANSRALAEKLTAHLNQLFAERLATENTPPDSLPLEPPLIARAHHGSVSKEQRAIIENALKAGELRCVVATSSLELGIDMGAVEQVIQIAPPPSVAAGLQRFGRANHQVGGVPGGAIYPRTRRELIDAIVINERMLAGRVEPLQPPSNPLDVLAQQTVAAAAMEPLAVDDWYALVTRSDPFRQLPRSAFDATLEMLAGNYSSTDFSAFRPLLIWDRAENSLTPRPGSHQLAVMSGGTIPDRGLFSVVLAEGEESQGARRVGELDEEMVYESRANDVITLGAASWRIQKITHDQVIVVPASPHSARLPFWRGDGEGRPADLGAAIGAFLGELERIGPGTPSALRRRLQDAGLNPYALDNLTRLVEEQRQATGFVPNDRQLLLESCRDEGGDWRVMLHSPFGKRVHGPWALALAARIRQQLGEDPDMLTGDDGIVLRFPQDSHLLPGASLFVFQPEELERTVSEEVGHSALFAARFRECAGRALYLPRMRPGKRSPLWQQRLRAAELLESARHQRDFPLLIETARECLQDVYDLPALRDLMSAIQAGQVEIREVTTQTPSPFASHLLFGYVGQFVYQGDLPLAERLSSVLSLDSDLLRELLGPADLSQVLHPQVMEQLEAELQHLSLQRRVRPGEALVDLLRSLGPLTVAEIQARLTDQDAPSAEQVLRQLKHSRRLLLLHWASQEYWAAIEDAALLRDALHLPLPEGISPAYLRPVAQPLLELIKRFARTHSAFSGEQLAQRFVLPMVEINMVLTALADQGLLIAYQADGRAQWIWHEVFRQLRARSLRIARDATRAVPQRAFVRLLLEHQGVLGTRPGRDLQGVEGVLQVVELLAGLPLPASLWESRIFPARVRDFQPSLLDELFAGNQVLWAGHGRLGDNDGLVSLHLAEQAGETWPSHDGPAAQLSSLQQALLNLLADGGAYRVEQLASRLQQQDQSDQGMTREPLAAALWDLAWRGLICCDRWAPLRALQQRQPAAKHPTPRPRRRLGRAPRHWQAAPGPVNTQDASTLGRWSLPAAASVSPTARLLALADNLCQRYGLICRAIAQAEQVPGGLPTLQPLLRHLEEIGQLLRGRFVEGLGAAQFAQSTDIDRLRQLAGSNPPASYSVALSAKDPANPFGSLLPWPAHAGLRPTRREGALVVIDDGQLVAYLSPGGHQLWLYIAPEAEDSAARYQACAKAIATVLRRDKPRHFLIQEIDGQPVWQSAFKEALSAAGFTREPRGYGY